MDVIEARRRLMRDPILPPIYQRVEYIQGNGQQYILINDQFNENVIFRLVCQAENTTASSQVVLAQSARGGYWFGYSGGNYGVGSGERHTFNIPITNKVTAIIEYKENINVRIGNEEKNMEYSSGGPRGLTIFGAQGGTMWFYSKAKIWSLKGEGVCDLIPCYRISDGEIGMYNAVTKQFLTNASGTGTFIKGPNVY